MPSGGLQYGSPLLALEAALEFESQVNMSAMKVNTKFRFIFIDEDKNAISFLKSQVARLNSIYNIPLHWIIDYHVGKFEDYSPMVIKIVTYNSKQAERAIFLLDQYGYAGVKITTIRKILSELKGSEVILTISTDWLADKSNADQLQERLLRMDFTQSEIRKLFVALNKQIPVGMNAAQFKRQTCQEFVLDAIASSAQFFNQYCIYSPVSGKSYVIVQLTNNIKGKEVMLEQFWKVGRFAVHELVNGLYLPMHQKDNDYFLFTKEYRENIRTTLRINILEHVKQAIKITALELYVKIANNRPETKLNIYAELRALQLDKIISANTLLGIDVRTINDNTIISLESQQGIFSTLDV